MNTFKNKKPVLKRRYVVMKYLAIILRVITLPIAFWYRLYLWVWDGAIFDDLFEKG